MAWQPGDHLADDGIGHVLITKRSFGDRSFMRPSAVERQLTSDRTEPETICRKPVSCRLKRGPP